MNKKYEFTGETLELYGITLHRIRAVKDFELVDGSKVCVGDLGGWIENENNLSHGGSAWVADSAWVYGNALVGGNAQVYGDAQVYGNALVGGNARVYGCARICGNAGVYDSARIATTTDYIVIGPIGSRDDFTTFYKTNSDGIYVACGCFNGNIDQFIDRVKNTHGSNWYAQAYLAAAELAKIQIGGGQDDM